MLYGLSEFIESFFFFFLQMKKAVFHSFNKYLLKKFYEPNIVLEIE